MFVVGNVALHSCLAGEDGAIEGIKIGQYSSTYENLG